MNTRRHSKYRDDYRRLVQKLAELREKSGLNSHQLADKLGWDHRLVQKVEAGEHRLDLVEFHHLCQALGQDDSEMLAGLERILANDARS